MTTTSTTMSDVDCDDDSNNEDGENNVATTPTLKKRNKITIIQSYSQLVVYRIIHLEFPSFEERRAGEISSDGTAEFAGRDGSYSSRQ